MTKPWKESTGNAWKPEKEGDFVEGLFIKVETNVGPNDSMMYFIEQKGGEGVIQVWGATILDSRMLPVKIGQEVIITYKGLAEKSTRGKQRAKIFKVEYRDPETQEDMAEDVGLI